MSLPSEVEEDLTTEWIRRIVIAGAAIILAGVAGRHLSQLAFLTFIGPEAMLNGINERQLQKLLAHPMILAVKSFGIDGAMALTATIIAMRWSTAFGWGARQKPRS